MERVPIQNARGKWHKIPYNAVPGEYFTHLQKESANPLALCFRPEPITIMDPNRIPQTRPRLPSIIHQYSPVQPSFHSGSTYTMPELNMPQPGTIRHTGFPLTSTALTRMNNRPNTYQMRYDQAAQTIPQREEITLFT